MDKTLPLTIDELTTYLAELAVRVERLEANQGKLVDVCMHLNENVHKHQEFQDVEIIKSRIDNLPNTKRYYKKTMDDLQAQFTGLVQWVNQQVFSDKKKRGSYD